MSSKPDLARAGTMQMTAKDGKVFLDKNLTEWKKPYLTEHLQDKDSDSGPSKPKMAKHTTMKGTAKEGKALLGGEKLSDTRQETKAKRKTPLKKNTTIQKTMAEAKAVFGDLDTSEGRRLRKRPEPKKPAMKKAGTMVRTAKEGKAFVKRSKKAAAAKEESSSD